PSTSTPSAPADTSRPYDPSRRSTAPTTRPLTTTTGGGEVHGMGPRRRPAHPHPRSHPQEEPVITTNKTERCWTLADPNGRLALWKDGDVEFRDGGNTPRAL